MKYILTFSMSFFFLLSCNNNVREKENMMKMNKSFKIYIRDNDLRKDLVTNLKKVKVLSYVEISDDSIANHNEKYEVQVHMFGTTSHMKSSRIYNLNDTVTCYYDSDFRMLRLVNPNN